MTCKVMDDLKSELSPTREKRAQYAYEKYRHARGGVSDREAKRIVKDQDREIAAMQERINWHRAACAECKL